MALPSTTDALVRWLDDMYPPRCIGRDQSLEDAHRYAGKRELVDNLLDHLRTETDIEAAMAGATIHVQTPVSPDA